MVDTLSKMTHDNDAETATNAIFAMGLVAAGTNNSKVASNLRSLATYYGKEPGLLFAVRIAQGLVHAAKGLVTLSPYHPDRSLPHPNALAALIAVSHICLDFKGLILGKHHFLLYTLVAAVRRPRLHRPLPYPDPIRTPESNPTRILGKHHFLLYTLVGPQPCLHP